MPLDLSGVEDLAAKAVAYYFTTLELQLVFSEKAKTIGPIVFGDVPTGSMQGPRYTTFDRLLRAKTLGDLFA